MNPLGPNSMGPRNRTSQRFWASSRSDPPSMSIYHSQRSTSSSMVFVLGGDFARATAAKPADKLLSRTIPVSGIDINVNQHQAAGKETNTAANVSFNTTKACSLNRKDLQLYSR